VRKSLDEAGREEGIEGVGSEFNWGTSSCCWRFDDVWLIPFSFSFPFLSFPVSFKIFTYFLLSLSLALNALCKKKILLKQENNLQRNNRPIEHQHVAALPLLSPSPIVLFFPLPLHTFSIPLHPLQREKRGGRTAGPPGKMSGASTAVKSVFWAFSGKNASPSLPLLPRFPVTRYASSLIRSSLIISLSLLSLSLSTHLFCFISGLEQTGQRRASLNPGRGNKTPTHALKRSQRKKDSIRSLRPSRPQNRTTHASLSYSLLSQPSSLKLPNNETDEPQEKAGREGKERRLIQVVVS